MREHTAMRVVDSRESGHDYAETLRRWRERFLAWGDYVAALGFDDTFRRMWGSTWPTPKRASGWATRVSASSPR